MDKTIRNDRWSARRVTVLAASSLLALSSCSGDIDDSGDPVYGAPTLDATSGMPQAPGNGPEGSGSNVGPPSDGPLMPGGGGQGNLPSPSGTPSGEPGAGGGAVTEPPPGAGGTPGMDEVLVDDGLPGRALIRRLSNKEYAATVETLLGYALGDDATDYWANFPEDTVVNGFTNNTDVQDVGPALAEQYVVTAEALSARAVQDADLLLGCSLSDGEACITDFIARFGKRAWRRPLTDAEQSELLALAQSEADPATGVQLLLQGLLNSPNFLYRAEVGVPVAGTTYTALTSWEVATRLSYFLTGTMPDDALFAAAEADTLITEEGVEAEARRLLSTDAARENVGAFFSGWLNLHAVDRLQRETEQFPNWDSQLPPLFYEETRVFAINVVFDGAGDLATLLTAPFTYGDPVLAEYYGGTAGPVENGIARIDLPPTQRAGLLTQASFLATHSKEIQTDPVIRGKFVRERMLCQGVPAPPPDLMVTAPTITPGSTTRQRFIQHQEDPVCATCHVMMDPIGLTFENYDPIGQWREQDQGIDVDASGELTFTDVTGPVTGVVEMAARLVESDMATECFARNWFRFAFGRAEGDSEAARMETITGEFNAADRRVQELLVALTLTPDFRLLAQDTTQ